MNLRRALPSLAVGLATAAGSPAVAGELYRGGDLVVRWDNTLKYSGVWRLEGPDSALISDPNGDWGDRGFPPGLVSNRLDLLSEIGVRAGRWGAEASAAAWYDTVYNDPIALSGTLPRPIYPTPTRFASSVRDLHGRKIELLNGYAYGAFDLGGAPLTVRLGRHTTLWGESLFFATNGIAAGQAPIDAIKAAGVPAVRAKEVFMPVAQVSATYQPRADLVLSAYYQLEWRRTRLPGAGSYFSTANFLDAGGDRLYVARNQFLTRRADDEPDTAGQFGLAVRFTGGAFDWGLYALRFHARDPQVYLRPRLPGAGGSDAYSGIERSAAYGYTPGIVGGTTGPSGLSAYPFGAGLPEGSVGTYQLVYPEGIESYGASFSGYMGESAVAGELSLRRNMPFVGTALIAVPGSPERVLYPRGDSLHGQVSLVTTLAPRALWRSADLSMEVAMNQRLHTAINAQALDPNRTRFAASLRVVFEPRYFAVLPGLDVSLPISVGHGLVGRSSTDASQDNRTGDITVGISATYRVVWQATVAMTRFLGPPARQPFADRHFIAMSLQRTF